MAILSNSNAISSGGYTLTNSLRFGSSASAYLNRTATTPTNAYIWTYSTWIKRGTLGTANYFFGAKISANQNTVQVFFDSSDKLNLVATDSSGVVKLNYITNAVYRDPSSWYHIVVNWNNSLASPVFNIYVNSVSQTLGTSTNTIAQNTAYALNGANPHYLGAISNTAGTLLYYDGYQTEVNFIDGQALTPSSFGETDTTTGVWKPKAYTGTYGTNGFYLKFSDIATTSGSNAGLGKDFSGNSNYWTTNNISVTSGTTYDAMTDVPTNTSATVANYCVANPLRNHANNAITNGNLNIAFNDGTLSRTTFSTFGVTSGKWYWEMTVTSIGVTYYPSAGVNTNLSLLPSDQSGSDAAGYMYVANGQKLNNGTLATYGSSYTTNDVIGVALDMDAGTITFYKNNTSQGQAYSGITGTAVPCFIGANGACAVNFGQRPFSYTPPTGYVALNTYNLPTPTILQGNKYMDATLYTGTGSSLNVTGVNFQPDFVWIKERVGAADHGLYDAVRGVQKQLESNTTDAETTETTGLTAFNSNGFTVGALAQLNTNTDTYVGWSWKANGAGSTNTSGSITSTVSVNTTAGFSVVTYTGTGANATVGHGLGVAAAMIIIKKRNTTDDWGVYHSALGNTKSIRLNTTAASDTNINYWNNTSPTSTTFSLGTNWLINKSADTYVAYCWAAIAGYSSFGSYTGNGSADGIFTYLGFLPKFILIKRTDSAGYNWYLWDTARNTYNVLGEELSPNLSDAAATQTDLDVTSNGFKIRTSAARINASGGTYIYACFASNPFRNSNAY